MRSLLIIIVLFLFCVDVFAQQNPYSTKNKDAINYYLAANHAVDDKDYDEAIIILQKAISNDSKFIEAHALMGDVYRQRKQNTPAIWKL